MPHQPSNPKAFSRRVFLKGSAAAIAAGLVASGTDTVFLRGIFAPRVVRAQSKTVVV